MTDQDNPVFRHRKSIWFWPLVLSCFGILTIASITSKGGLDGQINLYSTSGRQLFALVLGFTLMLIVSMIPLRVLRKCSSVFWITAILLTVATIIPGIGIKGGGARRWLPLGPFMLQPLEILSLFVPLHLSKCLSDSEGAPLEIYLRITIVIILASVWPLALQPNFGGMILIVVLCMSIHVENRGWKYPLFSIPVFISIAYPMIVFFGYRMRRISAFFDPWSDPLNSGFQAIQALIAFANGRIMGVGVGKGLQKLNYLPAAHTDFIFPAIGEEFGLVGTLGILLVFVFWFLVIWGLYRRQQDAFLSALTWGIAASVALPFFINLGGVMNLMPLTGIPLPFISYGGSSLVFMWIKIGILVRIAKESSEARAGT
ncbi:MAG: putative lipid II flippase FtsW [Synergistaceae bacterium]|nr:putative lipid II flippase FtsW [Synergistaceae bacterium]